MSNDTAAASETSIALINSAVVASPPVPTDPAGRQSWLHGVADLAVALYRRAQELDVDIARLAECKVIPAEIVRVEEAKGRGVITFRSPMGLPQHKAKDGTEQVRTEWLRDPRGASVFAQAQALVGRQVRLGKYIEAKKDGTGHEVAMLAWVDAVDGQAHADAPAPRDTQESRVAPHDTPPATAQHAPAATSGGLDLAGLRNLKLKSWDDLVAAAAEHFGLDADAAWAVGMEECGAAGPRNQVGMAKTWNKIVTRYFREAA